MLRRARQKDPQVADLAREEDDALDGVLPESPQRIGISSASIYIFLLSTGPTLPCSDKKLDTIEPCVRRVTRRDAQSKQFEIDGELCSEPLHEALRYLSEQHVDLGVRYIDVEAERRHADTPC